MATIVIRRPAAAAAAADMPVGEILAGMAGEALAAAAAEETEVSVEDLSAGDREELEASSEFITAESMPLTLIEPLDAAAADDGTLAGAAGGQAAWGIV
ncbi:MAG: hypothetical protein M3N07_08300, partial [Pseudomonadota bacterium]|nr:hypothetical protein [Pseudomonadota bacterium]